MTGIAGQGMVLPTWLFLIGWSVWAVLCEDDTLYSTCPEETGSFYSTREDCLIYYECANNKIWTKVCFPWQRFDVHQLKCRDFTEVDCNPEYTGIWRRTYGQWSGDSGGYTIGETDTSKGEKNQTNTQDKGVEGEEMVGNDIRVDNLPQGTEPTASAEASGEDNTILSLVKNLESGENQFANSKILLLKIEEIKEYNVLIEEDNFISGNNRLAKRFVPDDYLLPSDGTTDNDSGVKENSQKKFKNVLLMNVDEQSLNSILNWLVSNQMMNVNNRDTYNPSTSTIGETLAFDMSCARPVNIAPQNMGNNGAEQPDAGGITPFMENVISTVNPSTVSNAEDSNGGFWYWCGSGRFVYTQSNEQGDSLCEQLQDPQFINQEGGGGSQQGGDWSGHTFLG